MPMRDVIREAIEEGGATKESLMELVGTTEKGLASQFSYLRMIGTCPLRQEDGTYKIVSAEEWKEYRESRTGNARETLSPEERVEKCNKREERATVAYDKAKKRADDNPDSKLDQLYLVKAEAELDIASILLGHAEDILKGEMTK